MLKNAEGASWRVGLRTDADIVVGEAQHISYGLLTGIRRLRAGPYGDGAVFIWLCNRNMRLHVHVLLRRQHVPAHHPRDSGQHCDTNIVGLAPPGQSFSGCGTTGRPWRNNMNIGIFLLLCMSKLFCHTCSRHRQTCVLRVLEIDMTKHDGPAPAAARLHRFASPVMASQARGTSSSSSMHVVRFCSI